MPSVILNFHGVGPLLRSADDGERHCWLDQNHFEAVLDVARDHSSVRLTVDDGNASDFEYILPALLRRGLKATFFVCAGRLDQPGFLGGEQVRELRRHGMGIGSHGVAHIPWRKLPPPLLQTELESSRQVLESVCETSIESAACPFGSYDRTVLEGLRQAGYRCVYTSDGGASDLNEWIQARTTVTRSMPPETIESLVRHGVGALKQRSIDARKLWKRLR